MTNSYDVKYRDSYQLWNCECTDSFTEVHINHINCHSVTIKLTKAILGLPFFRRACQLLLCKISYDSTEIFAVREQIAIVHYGFVPWLEFPKVSRPVTRTNARAYLPV